MVEGSLFVDIEFSYQGEAEGKTNRFAPWLPFGLFLSFMRRPVQTEWRTRNTAGRCLGAWPGRRLPALRYAISALSPPFRIYSVVGKYGDTPTRICIWGLAL